MREKLLYMLKNSCKKIYKDDKYLIDKGVCERAIVFRFGVYLQRLISRDSELKFYDLDNEYNRNQEGVKRTRRFKNGTYPDLIIHKRGENSNNIMVVEFKTVWNSDTSKDEKKLKDFINKNGEYKYKYGVSIIFEENKAVIKMLYWYKEKCIKKDIYNVRFKSALKHEKTGTF